MTDGTSKTFALTEMIQAPSDTKTDRRGRIWNEKGGAYHVTTRLTPNSKESDVTVCDNRPDENLPCIDRPAAQWRSFYLAARSRHSGGVNVLMLDGSVDLTDDDVELEIWQSMSTMAGEDPPIARETTR